MKARTTLLLLICASGFGTFAQPVWPKKADRIYLLDNFRRTRNEVNQETAGLSPAQWRFREGAGTWSIGQVLEHLTMWELITLSDARYALYLGPNPALAAQCRSDSVVASFIYETNPHISPDFTVPMGLTPDGNNLTLFNEKCDLLLRQIEQAEGDLGQYVRAGKDGNHRTLAQVYIIQFGHTDRHLRQIRRIKEHPDFPKQ